MMNLCAVKEGARKRKTIFNIYGRAGITWNKGMIHFEAIYPIRTQRDGVYDPDLALGGFEY